MEHELGCQRFIKQDHACSRPIKASAGKQRDFSISIDAAEQTRRDDRQLSGKGLLKHLG